MTHVGVCPAKEKLYAFLLDEIKLDDNAPVVEHIDKCESCRAIVESLLEDSDIQKWRQLHNNDGFGLSTANDTRLEQRVDAFSDRVGRGSLGSRFTVQAFHARGGLGDVFVARDEELGREVALKQIQSKYADRADNRARFILEAEITGGLEHPGIVPVYGLGKYEDGRPFYAMRFIRGENLKDAITSFHSDETNGSPGTVDKTTNTSINVSNRFQSLEFRKLLGRFVDVCNAIQYAHARGVLHRDLKPGNIMLGSYGETLVVDWGLAKAHYQGHQGSASEEKQLQLPSGISPTPTQGGGTPAYMSPEQASGRMNDVGPTSDVYSLGATLYHLLTGKPPFNGSIAQILKSSQSGDFPRPRRVHDSIAKPLEAVCLKAMALRPHDRYASPAALADDVEKWMADEPVSARAEPLSVRTRRWLKRHPRTVASLAATLLVGLVSSLAITALISKNNEQLTDLNKELRIARDDAELKRQAANMAQRKVSMILRQLPVAN